MSGTICHLCVGSVKLKALHSECLLHSVFCPCSRKFWMDALCGDTCDALLRINETRTVAFIDQKPQICHTCHRMRQTPVTT
jgi:hypothetical protein